MGSYKCPCCGNYSLDDPPGSYDICEICGWEDDPLQSKSPDLEGGANSISLNQAKKEYEASSKNTKRAGI